MVTGAHQVEIKLNWNSYDGVQTCQDFTETEKVQGEFWRSDKAIRVTDHFQICVKSTDHARPITYVNMLRFMQKMQLNVSVIQTILIQWILNAFVSFSQNINHSVTMHFISISILYIPGPWFLGTERRAKILAYFWKNLSCTRRTHSGPYHNIYYI